MLVLRVLAAPFWVVMALLIAAVSFLYCVASTICSVGCVLLTLLACALLIAGQTTGGAALLIFAFLLSPLGIPAIADWLMKELYAMKYSLQDFITG